MREILVSHCSVLQYGAVCQCRTAVCCSMMKCVTERAREERRAFATRCMFELCMCI